jgi:hypothetical protein
MYALVRHTGYSQTEHAEFQQAVEERSVTPAIAHKINVAGGMIADDYTTAEALAERVNYPPADPDAAPTSWLVPQARGKFLRIPGFDEEIYLPHREDQ